jgi:LmbE family N-acetylglucosaminyl deacetylase
VRSNRVRKFGMASSKCIIFSPHPDDAEIGCPGFLNDATVILFTGTELRARETSDALERHRGQLIRWPRELLDGRIEFLPEDYETIDELTAGADMIFTPPVDDHHQDHRALAWFGKSAIRRRPITLVEYETPSRLDTWSPNAYKPLSTREVYDHLDALEAHKTQSDKTYLHPDNVKSKLRTHGERIGHEFAAAFNIQRYTFQ